MVPDDSMAEVGWHFFALSPVALSGGHLPLLWRHVGCRVLRPFSAPFPHPDWCPVFGESSGLEGIFESLSAPLCRLWNLRDSLRCGE